MAYRFWKKGKDKTANKSVLLEHSYDSKTVKIL